MNRELCSYAVSEDNSRGRLYREEPHRYRTDFERDRDRVIHSSSFRRLEGKTQVFTPGLDDHYRTRMTHSIEVSQIGRTIAKAIGVNESLTEAICLAHDLGHPPFGHTGEEILNELMADFGGFEHNQQTLRIVELLEHPYPDFMGLNLMYETRLGLAKHRSTYDDPKGGGFAELNCSLEGQVADVSDRIAYNCHDLEDGMRAGLIRTEKLKELSIFAEAQKRIKAESIDDRTIRRTRTAKAIIDRLVGGCIEQSNKAIERAGIKTLEDIYSRADNLILLSEEHERELAELEGFLLNSLYHSAAVTQTQDSIRGWLGGLFEQLCRETERMPEYFQGFIQQEGLRRVVCDYIAGMTDRYCIRLAESG